jgi:putative ABC transport system substrate-binding protein
MAGCRTCTASGDANRRIFGVGNAGGVSAWSSFLQGLSALGYNKGQSLTIEWRWAGGQTDRLSALASDLVRRQIDVIAVPGSVVAAVNAKAATTTIPIVFEMGLDSPGGIQ